VSPYGEHAELRPKSQCRWFSLGRIFTSDHLRDRVVTTLRVYLDESEGDVPFVAAGWVCPAERWDEISERWQRVLDAVPAIAYFSLNDAMGLKGPFLGWDEKMRDEKIRALARTLPHERWFFGHGCHVTRTIFETIVKERVKRIYRNPYFFCISAAIVTAVSVGPNRFLGADKVDFVLDRSKAAQRMRNIFYDHIQPKFPMLGECTDLDDEITNPLQAADLCVGLLRQHFEPSPISLPGMDELTQSPEIPAGLIELRGRELNDILDTPLFKKQRL